jgi:hypothetical protein
LGFGVPATFRGSASNCLVHRHQPAAGSSRGARIIRVVPSPGLVSISRLP